jgi:hypothetical protein
MLSRLITTLGLIAGLYPAAAVAAERPIVVELYTSQGCSSASREFSDWRNKDKKLENDLLDRGRVNCRPQKPSLLPSAIAIP